MPSAATFGAHDPHGMTVGPPVVKHAPIQGLFTWSWLQNMLHPLISILAWILFLAMTVSLCHQFVKDFDDFDDLHDDLDKLGDLDLTSLFVNPGLLCVFRLGAFFPCRARFVPLSLRS